MSEGFSSFILYLCLTGWRCLSKTEAFCFAEKIYSVDSVVSLKKDIYAFGNVLKLKISDGTEYFIHINAKDEYRLREKLDIA